MSRPTGITVIGCLQFAGGISAAALGIAVLKNPAATADWGLPPAFATMGVAGAIIMIVYGVLNLTVGWGLLKLFNWARVIVLALTGLGLVGAASGILFGGVNHQPLATDVLQLVAFALDALVIWYLLRPESKQAFTPSPPSQQPGAPPAEPPPAS